MRYQLGTEESNPEIGIWSRKPFHFPSGSLRKNVTKSKGEITRMPKLNISFIPSELERITHANINVELNLRKTMVNSTKLKRESGRRFTSWGSINLSVSLLGLKFLSNYGILIIAQHTNLLLLTWRSQRQTQIETPHLHLWREARMISQNIL